MLESVNKLKISIPSDVLKIHAALKKAGKKLYVVGGAVRDAILGKTPKDFDLATDAKPDEVLQIAKSAGMHTTEVGKSFGIVVVDGHEVATFRKDIGKGRRPDSVEYTDIKGDVERRDLTINALFYDIDRGEIVDLVGGIKDLKRNRIRTVGAAEERFEEDPLRKLRVLRFATRMGGKVETSTLKALKDNPSLNGVSEERIYDEFTKSIISAKSSKSYLQLAELVGILSEIFPKLNWNKKNFVDTKNYRILVAKMFSTYPPDFMYKYLMARKWTHSDANDVKFLLSLLSFTADDVFRFKKMQENVELTSTDIVEWGRINGMDFRKFVKFKLSVNGGDVMNMGFKGKDIGIQISKMERDKFLNEGLKEKGITDFKSLFKMMPTDLQKRVYNLKNIPQRPDYHPEGNTLKHTITVVNRSLKSDDIDLAIAAIMHDIGKDETAKPNPKTGWDSHHGHEAVSAKLVKKYSNWIITMGGNVANIYYIVKNHMRFKQLGQMNHKKVKKLQSFRAYPKLSKFGTEFDRGGLDI